MTKFGSSRILVDTCFWIALFAESGDVHETALTLEPLLNEVPFIIPFPTVYETLRTRFVGNVQAMEGYERVLVHKNVEIVEDYNYKDEALTFTLSKYSRSRRLSLVDNILRLMLDDTTLRIKCLFTFNDADFIDVCAPNSIDMLPGK